MKALDTLLDAARDQVRAVMRVVARSLNTLSGGRLHPNTVTLSGLAMHVPISWLIAQQQYYLAAILLIIFGLFDNLDGALARLQKSESQIGMLLDSVSDRVKEIILYAGITLAFVASGQAGATVWAVLACGSSLLVSYVNAWGEAVIARLNLRDHQTNKAFRSGLMTFEIRMFVLIIGLLTNQLLAAVIFIALASWLTAIGRLINVSRRLR
jgi:phosphatidylglycerophosphate synthase